MKTQNSLIKRIILLAIISLAVNQVYAKSRSSKNPGTVVALSKSVTEMWLLAGGEIVGTTDDALELSGAEKAVSVGSLTTSSLEAIVSLNPDFVILTQDIPLHKKLYGNLKSIGIRTYIADVKCFADYDRVLRDFTELTGRSDLYNKNVVDVKKEIDEVVGRRKILKQVQDDRAASDGRAASDEGAVQKTYLLLRVSSAKNKVLKDHFGNEILQDFGLRSMVQDDSALDEIGIEAIVSSDPDYIFVVHQGKQKNAEEAFYKAYSSNPAWNSLSAVRNGNVFVLPKDLFNYKPNARWAEAYKVVEELL